MEKQAPVQVTGQPELSAAYCKFYAEVQNATKNADNSFFKSSYADLGEIIATVKPVLAKYGLAVLQVPGRLVWLGGNQDAALSSSEAKSGGVLAISVLTQLLHTSGQFLAVETQMPVTPSYNKKTGAAEYGPQPVGSAISYTRRYALAAICGITQQDDDGNAAQGKTEGFDAKADESDLPALIAAAATVAELEAVKSRVQELGDKAVGALYVAKNRELKKVK